MPPSSVKKSVFSREYEVFLELLQKARKDAGFTQEQAAKELNRPQSFVSKCESGERRVDIVELMQFCEAYGIPVDEFTRRLLAAIPSR